MKSMTFLRIFNIWSTISIFWNYLSIVLLYVLFLPFYLSSFPCLSNPYPILSFTLCPSFFLPFSLPPSFSLSLSLSHHHHNSWCILCVFTYISINILTIHMNTHYNTAHTNTYCVEIHPKFSHFQNSCCNVTLYKFSY